MDEVCDNLHYIRGAKLRNPHAPQLGPPLHCHDFGECQQTTWSVGYLGTGDMPASRRRRCVRMRMLDHLTKMERPSYLLSRRGMQCGHAHGLSNLACSLACCMRQATLSSGQQRLRPPQSRCSRITGCSGTAIRLVSTEEKVTIRACHKRDWSVRVP